MLLWAMSAYEAGGNLYFLEYILWEIIKLRKLGICRASSLRLML